MASQILVFADWAGLAGPQKLGTLHCWRTRGSERFEFEFVDSALAGLAHQALLDPRLQPFAGRQFPAQGTATFGLFADASPDHWGRLLMRRRHERDVRTGVAAEGSKLFESDYLLGVHDSFRVGAIRFKTDVNGPFLDDHHDTAAPPMTSMRELEEASRRFEQGEDMSDGRDWLRMLIAPGGSLGGARPKASVVDPDNALWIAKFPSNNDEHDVGAWEMVVNILANACGLRVAEATAGKYASDHHCFMVKRFDRTATGERLHFASAMTMTEHVDGEDHSTGVSYLEIAEVLMRHGATPEADLQELWKRIVFNMLVSNTDDHLRNHGFILVPDKGWQLSAAYDMNPVPYADGLKLNVSESDNALDLDLALSVAGYFRLKQQDALEIIEDFRTKVRLLWRPAAKKLGISVKEQGQMASAFRLAD
ncbi:type II toxin-antitoxin system HipA family toxin [Pseudomonas sp. NPDC077186]|uniref:type II toxin-antitoxin system HipA family toxin n=1 Tax=Pseudomonas sp. NPDC077186 TaxID=3364421 RepID=UPI0037CA699B